MENENLRNGRILGTISANRTVASHTKGSGALRTMVARRQALGDALTDKPASWICASVAASWINTPDVNVAGHQSGR
jgi:hypothetical protein